ncbi:hypothetical protein CROQUDRAFT_649964 [Cronartium quercuum f. sp. fusiforme G11]|uniref:Uncharacterized protein n=1 Tax=Cronartium quercuum f. sp. fusiforme G11 TaxID=708437 RepID=A0A9P6TI94_9BASI|nr:hypothetical protein CROQUDRAFT_649964 [Cronartium quercuum f. sp. fusiforme G11]
MLFGSFIFLAISAFVNGQDFPPFGGGGSFPTGGGFPGGSPGFGGAPTLPTGPPVLGKGGYSITCDPGAQSQSLVVMKDCVRALKHYPHQTRMLIEEAPSSRRSCMSCELWFIAQNAAGIAIPIESVRNAMWAILSQCNSHAGSTNVYQGFSGASGSSGILTVGVRNGIGNDCIPGQHPNNDDSVYRDDSSGSYPDGHLDDYPDNHSDDSSSYPDSDPDHGTDDSLTSLRSGSRSPRRRPTLLR